MSKGGFMKDALILFAITLVAGACLGGAYEITKGPIQAAELAAKEDAFRTVLADADSFQLDDYSAALEKANGEVAGLSFGNVQVDECATGMDGSGSPMGYVVTATSKDGYGGNITVSVSGASADNEIDAIGGATITSNAVTGAVNSALYFVNNCVLQ